MNFWEQLLIFQGLGALHAVINKFGAKYFKPDELATLQSTADLMSSLGDRLNKGGPLN